MFPTNDELFNLMLLKGITGGAVEEATATGNPATFLTDLAKPLKSLLINLLPFQSGSGDPSPQNIRPIVPWESLTVWNGGKNLIDSTKRFVASATQIYLGNTSTTYTIELTAGTYTFAIGYKSSTGYDVYYKGETVAQTRIINKGTVAEPYIKAATFTIEEGDTFRFWLYSSGGVSVDNVAWFTLVEGSEALIPTETDISFPSPVYGGEHEAVSGVLQARQYDSVTFKWGDATNRTVIGNVERRGFIVPRQVKSQDDLNADPTARFCSVAPWKYSYSSDDVHYYGGGYSFYVFLPVGTDENLEFQLVVERPLPPQEITLTPEQITALKGNNTIWSDANGNLEITYLKKG